METIKEKVVAQKLSEKYMRMSDGAVESLSSILVCKEIDKNQLLLKEGDICEHLYFVDKGLVRQFYYKYGRDMTENFAMENEICFNAESYLYRKPSIMMIEALEPTLLYCIPNKSLFSLINDCPDINKMYRLMLESLLMQSYRRIDSFRLELASERYKRFVKEMPSILQRAPLLHIASFLLMTPETLSRVRGGQNRR
jgi:CRP-like cAMP-binding protein